MTQAPIKTKAKIRPCPQCYKPLSQELVCDLHGQLKECWKCKQIINTRGECGCVLKVDKVAKVVTPKSPKKRGPGKRIYAPPPKECLVCGVVTTRKYCVEHRKWLQMVHYWMKARNLTELEAVDLLKGADKRVTTMERSIAQECSSCGRIVTYLQPGTLLCGRCVLRSKPPAQQCKACEGPLYSKYGNFCKEEACNKLSLRFSYYRRCGKSDEEIWTILAPAIEKLRQGIVEPTVRTDFTKRGAHG